MLLGGVDSASSGDAADRSTADEAVAAPTADGEGGAAGDLAGAAQDGAGTGVDLDAVDAAEGREIILTGRVTVVVDDLDAAVDRVGRITEGVGGLVFGEETTRASDPGSVLTLKVPPAAFEDVLDEVAGLGEAQDRRIDSSDVTAQVVDLDSRIATAEASVDRLRALILRAEDIDDIAILENELLQRETTLEELRGQRRTLGDQVALATITVTLTPTPDSPDTPQEDDELPGFLGAFRSGWDLLLGVATVLGLVLFAVAPWIPLALVAWLVVVVVRRRLRRRAPAPPAGPEAGGGPGGGHDDPTPPPPPPVPVGAGAAAGPSSPEGQSLS